MKIKQRTERRACADRDRPRQQLRCCREAMVPRGGEGEDPRGSACAACKRGTERVGLHVYLSVSTCRRVRASSHTHLHTVRRTLNDFVVNRISMTSYT